MTTRLLTTTLTTVCPFCGGGIALLTARTQLTNAELTSTYAGRRLQCVHRECEKMFTLRRGDLVIRRDEE